MQPVPDRADPATADWPVVLYARVSTEDQKELSIPGQLQALRDQAHQRGWRIVQEFVDEGRSATTDDRAGFQAMMALAQTKPVPFRSILVWKLSRFARSRQDSVVYKSLLRRRGIQVVSLHEPIDDTPSGQLLEGIIEVLDEFYSRNLAQDVIRGMTDNAARGHWNGSLPPYGYRLVTVPGHPSRLDVHPDTAPWVVRIFEWTTQGWGRGRIVRELMRLGAPSPRGRGWGRSAIEYVTRNEIYVGTLVWGPRPRQKRSRKRAVTAAVRVPHTYPALIAQELFDRAQRAIDERRTTGGRPSESAYVLTGLLRCGRCGAPMSGHGSRDRRGVMYRYYRCLTRDVLHACASPHIPQAGADHRVIQHIHSVLLAEPVLSEIVLLIARHLRTMPAAPSARQLADIDLRIARLVAAIEQGIVSLEEAEGRLRALRQERELAGASAEATLDPSPTSLTRIRADLRHVRHDLRSLDGQVLRPHLRKLLARVEWHPPELRLTYQVPLPNDLPTAISLKDLLRNRVG